MVSFLPILFPSRKRSGVVPVSCNYFPHRQCNYKCHFCFHTTKNLDILPIDEAKQALTLLHAAGMKKLNISGGEPFLQPEFIGEIFRFCKEELKLESTSVVNNGSKVTERWLDQYGQYLDIMAISCDSFDPEANILIGRSDNGTGHHISRVFKVAQWCHERGIRLKINTVVNTHNWQEDMSYAIEELNPFRWKVFQVLLLDGENTGSESGSLRDARAMVISNDQFKSFLDRHSRLDCLVPEDNDSMRDSYLLLDENMCFLDSRGGVKKPGRSVLKVGVHEALKDAGFDEAAFVKRGGIFDWGGKKKTTLDW